ncbi:MAG: hypothetical protein L0312_14995 [Acidobacteria bacterium]|nr:hypothetical protein [Acidobacteriota bacterium]
MADQIDKEIEAIKAVLHALEPLPGDVRASVLGYVIQRLQITLVTSQYNSGAAGALTDMKGRAAEAVGERETLPVHIKVFKEKKKPRSANEMAAIVAYFLANLAPKAERKDRITAKDIETYFKIAEFPLTKTQFTLPNAKAAGYLDAVGNGAYKLNAVGHNLVVHSMPRGADSKAVSRKRPTRKARPAKKR